VDRGMVGKAGTFRIVGIGASAGGLGAFEKFFSAMPADTGMAFVLVQHLDPNHESLMAHLLSRYTTMAVIEAKDQMPVAPNRLYMIPPNAYLTISGSTLHLREPVLQRGMRMPIDYFLRSLAEAHREKAIAIILSGTGSDGTLGIRAIKGEGGIALAQSPETAQYDGMPRSAIATGLVDYVGAVESMPDVLVRYNAHAFAGKAVEPAALAREEPDVLRSILSVLQTRTKYDFRCYKKGTLLRRITRRMGLNQIEGLGAYLAFLGEHPDEPTQLFRDLLIGVSGFFRDPPAFEALEKVIVKIIEGKGSDQAIRIWVPGCSSGEEPYSIAILVAERLQVAQKNCPIQIYATDIDEAALAAARAGLYPENIAADISQERLQRFFKREEHAFRVSQPVRDTVVFAVQNLIADPPFSALDLVSCRNLLIYLEPDVQKKVISLFHFALNDGGYLLLGSAETIGSQDRLFEPVSKKWRLYRRLGAPRRNLLELPIFPAQQGLGVTRSSQRPLLEDPVRLGELIREVLLEAFAPAAVLVDRRHQIVYYHGPTGRYFDQPAGPPSEDLMRKVRGGLRNKVRGLLHKASQDGHAPISGAVDLGEADSTRRVRITVTPLVAPRDVEGLALVSFQDEPALAGSASQGAGEREGPGDEGVQELERELQVTRDDLQSTIEEMESSNEELKAANEEIMSVNEELQSANEELETSKEELQSLNEELSTVNSELEEKVRELEATNDDLDNLLISTDIATIFLDRELHIKRFTPSITRLFNLIATDLGRSVNDISRKFDDPDLLADARKVLERLVPIEKDVGIADDRRHWYTRRILPYRTGDDRIQGVVITFIDVTERKRALQWFRLIVEAAPDAVVVADKDGRIETVNAQTEQFFGYQREELIGKPVEMLVPEGDRERHCGDREAFFAKPEPRPMGRGRELSGQRKDGSEFPVEIGLSPVETERGTYVLATIVDITERRRADAELRAAKEQAERASRAKSQFLSSASHDLRQPLQTLTLLNGVLARKIENAELLKSVKMQSEALTSMNRLLHTFLDLGRIDAGVIAARITPFPVARLLHSIESEFRPLAETRDLDLRILPCSATIRSDEDLLHQILQNLVANAIKHTEAGRILVGCRRRGGMLRIEVWDSGPGIPREHLDTIFDEFFQLSNPARQADKGYGVGLSIVRSLARTLEHRLDVRSTPGKGSMFAVEVDTASPGGSARRKRKGVQGVPYRGRPGAVVMLVEDDAGVRGATQFLLEGFGLDVMAVSACAEAMALIRSGRQPDLIIADYRLAQGESGAVAIRRIVEELGRTVPALLVSGDFVPDAAGDLQTGGFLVLQKPIDVDQLIAHMNKLLQP